MFEYIDYFHVIPTKVYKNDRMMFMYICFNISTDIFILSSYEFPLRPLTNPSNAMKVVHNCH